MVYLDIWLFGCNSSTSFAKPKFPLIFNETFSFHEVIYYRSHLDYFQIFNLFDVTEFFGTKKFDRRSKKFRRKVYTNYFGTSIQK